MIHVVQTEGPHAEYPYPAPRELGPVDDRHCHCGEIAQFWYEMGPVCARCAGPLAMTAIMVPIEAKRHG
jgi:hypothetical protein